MSLERIPLSPPAVQPVPPGTVRPLWSVMIPVYNCSAYLEETLQSVLCQDPGPDHMQIEVVDDASTDADVEALVQRIGKGRVSYFRQPENVGSVRNFETCLNRSRGQLLHLLHGDDRARPGYYAAMELLFQNHPTAGAAFSRLCYIDSAGQPDRYTHTQANYPGILDNFMEIITRRQVVQYVCMTVKRSVYESLGGFYGVNYGEDWEMWARIGSRYPVAYTPELLADYREHDSNISSAKFSSGQHLLDLEKVFRQILSYLPAAERRAKRRLLWGNYIRWTLDIAFESWFNHKNRDLVLNQVRMIPGRYWDRNILKRLVHMRLLLWRTATMENGSVQLQQVDLSAGITLPDAVQLADGGVYAVYWWKDIPLGHISWNRGEETDSVTALEKIKTAIQPAVVHYVASDGGSFPGWPAVVQEHGALLQDNGAALRDFLSTLLPPAATPLPATVPISVVICTRKRSIDLEKSLRSLTSLPCQPSEIIVVHNDTESPVDHTEGVVRSFPGVIYTREPRRGLDYARNAGAHRATCSIVAYLDDDVQLQADWAYQTWRSFEDPSIAATTGLVIAAELKTASQQYFEKYWSFNRGYVPIRYGSDYFHNDKDQAPRVWNIGAGANMAFRKSVLEEVNYFDERLDAGQAGCSGDSEIWFRVLAAGHSILYQPRVVAFHHHRKYMKDLQIQLYNYMRGHAAAALIQHAQYPMMGWRRRVFRQYPRTYFNMLRGGFPKYKGRFFSLFLEIRGFLAGILFYYQNRKRPHVVYPENNEA